MSIYRQEEWRDVNPDLDALQTPNDGQPENSLAPSGPENSQAPHQDQVEGDAHHDDANSNSMSVDPDSDALQTPHDSLPENSLAPVDPENSQAPHQDQAESDANLDDANSNSSSPPNREVSHDQRPKKPVQSILDREQDLWGYNRSVSEPERDQEKPPRITPTKLEIPNDDLQGIRPIPSIIGMEQDPYDRPWDPNEPVYTMLFTRKDRNEARRLRDQIRHHGFWGFGREWRVRKQRAAMIGSLGGLTFRHRTSKKITLSVAWGNREAVDGAMVAERARPGGVKRVLLLERDGGEVRIDSLQRKYNNMNGKSYTFTITLLEIFKDFEV